MINFIFVAMILSFALLALAVFIKNYAIGIISSMAIIVASIFIIINGITGLDAILEESLGLICLGFGMYALISGSIEQLEELD